MNNGVPVHESFHLVDVSDLYRTDEWWKAVVTYQFEGDADTNETAVYLWHRDDDDWNRKNKYVIKTPEAWSTDRKIITKYLESDRPSDVVTEFPVSDYYSVGDGTTIFQSNGWWKAIVNVVEKGTYESNEVMVYLWQKRDNQWRRSQKHTIKNVSDWEEEREIIDDQIGVVEQSTVSNEIDDIDDGASGSLSTLSAELDAHLSEEFS